MELNGEFNQIDYKKKNICPVTEKIMKENFINLPLSLIKFDKKKLQKIVKSFEKVWKNLDKLKKKNNSKLIFCAINSYGSLSNFYAIYNITLKKKKFFFTSKK